MAADDLSATAPVGEARLRVHPYPPPLAIGAALAGAGAALAGAALAGAGAALATAGACTVAHAGQYQSPSGTSTRPTQKVW